MGGSGTYIASLTIRELISLAIRVSVDLDEHKLVMDHVDSLALTRPLSRDERIKYALMRGAKVV